MDKRHGWGRRGYHHGNLREALLKAARQLIEQRGPEGFTLAEAARLAGVSPAAPYRHFRDRDALLAELARGGFERFADVLAEAWDGGRPTSLKAFERLGQAYLKFAHEERASYAAMFEAAFATAPAPELKMASDRAFDVLQRACEALSAALPEAQRPPTRLMGLHVWAMAHGAASLFGEEGPARGKVPLTPEEILESAVLIYLKGLGILPGEGGGAGPR